MCPHTTCGANLRARPRHARVRAALRRDVRRREDALDRGRARRRVDRDRRSRHRWKAARRPSTPHRHLDQRHRGRPHGAEGPPGSTSTRRSRTGPPNARVGVLRARRYERCVDAPRSTLTFAVITPRPFSCGDPPVRWARAGRSTAGLHAFPPAHGRSRRPRPRKCEPEQTGTAGTFAQLGSVRD